jgi:uncharacterized protein YndB with AHSA1/START domain
MTKKFQHQSITIQTIIQAPVGKVWEYWTNPKHITQWNKASEDWHTTRAENDLQVGGKFLSRMESRDGSMGFDFSGEYLIIELYKQISYLLDDGRKVQVNFKPGTYETLLTEVFESEQENPPEMQQAGWQAILDNFKKYVESAPNPGKIYFGITIQSTVEKVYKIMLEDAGYREWTSVFNPTSRYEGSWQKGSRILFLGTNHDGKAGGMVSRIRENTPNEYVSIEHLGMVKDGIEILPGPEVESWAGILENYTFTSDDGNTFLSVDLDSNPEFESYFSETWPKALAKLKEICER